MRSIRRRWYFWLVVLGALPVLFFGIGLIYSGQGPINQANFDRVQEGITEEQVVAILGEPTFREGSSGDQWAARDLFLKTATQIFPK